MITANFHDSISLDAALRRAARLWPDPWEAPEVPPRELLQQFYRGVQFLPAEFRVWLPAQIAESVNCQRALDQLRAQLNPQHVLHSFVPSISEEADVPNESGWQAFASKHFPRDRAPEEEANSGAGDPARIFVEPALDQLWATKARVERFNGRGLESRYTWEPAAVLLAEPAFQGSGGETLWRAIPCTPLWLWGEENVGSEEAPIEVSGKGQFIAHFNLEYPIHSRQLYTCIGLTEDTELRAGTAQTTPELALERERLVDCAEWLCATADARRQWFESMVVPSEAAAIDDRKFASWLDQRYRSMPVSSLASLEPGVFCVLWREELSALYRSVLGGELAGGYEFTAKMQDEPQEDSDRFGQCLAQWQIEDPTAVERLREGNTFHVANGDNFSNIIGHGLVRRVAGRTLARLEIGRWADFNGVRNFTLLFPNSF